jgi:hypothetical protein
MHVFLGGPVITKARSTSAGLGLDVWNRGVYRENRIIAIRDTDLACDVNREFAPL